MAGERDERPTVPWPRTRGQEPGHTIDDVATGLPENPKLTVLGRPDPAHDEKYLILEEPGPNVLVHYVQGRGLQPHWIRDCPNCPVGEPQKPMWYMGAMTWPECTIGILELTHACFRTATAAASSLPLPVKPGPILAKDAKPVSLREAFEKGTGELPELASDPTPKLVEPVYRGLVVSVGRKKFAMSARVLRCSERVAVDVAWAYQTRYELARIWGIPVRPRLMREQA